MFQVSRRETAAARVTSQLRRPAASVLTHHNDCLGIAGATYPSHSRGPGLACAVRPSRSPSQARDTIPGPRSPCDPCPAGPGGIRPDPSPARRERRVDPETPPGRGSCGPGAVARKDSESPPSPGPSGGRCPSSGPARSLQGRKGRRHHDGARRGAMHTSVGDAGNIINGLHTAASGRM